MSGDSSFRMTITDLFNIRGSGVVVTGRVESGVVTVGDEIYIRTSSGVKNIVVAGLEAFHKQVPQAQAGDNVGVLLKGVEAGELQRGDVLSGSDAG